MVQVLTSEYEGLTENNTFEYIAVTKDRKLLESTWIFRWNVNGEEEVARAKARLVAKGFSQVSGVDFDETFSQTPHLPSVRLVLAVAIQQDLDSFTLMLSKYLSS